MKRFALMLISAVLLLCACAPAAVLPLPEPQPAAQAEPIAPDIVLAQGESTPLPTDGSVTYAALDHSSTARAISIAGSTVTVDGSTHELSDTIASAWLTMPKAGDTAVLLVTAGKANPTSHSLTYDGAVTDRGSVPGSISDVTEDYILITDTFNVMGTRRGTAKFALSDDLRLTQLPGSLWILEPGPFVTTAQELVVSPMDGCGCAGEDALMIGTKLRPTATDRDMEILYENDAGIAGTIIISGYQNGLPMIDGKPETEWFSELEYDR